MKQKTDWEQRLKDAGWRPGDIYNPADPLHPFHTKNVRILLLNAGLWSERLVDLITLKRHYNKNYKIKTKIVK